MTATIIAFPHRTINLQRLALVGTALRDAIPIAPRDAELDLLLTIGGKLLDNLADHTAVDCWLVRLDEWEAKNAG
ncbi:hypothetical protein [Sphingomonas sp.]|jgi:hypothetical protein|uniref:hypothetical protein n=1 Tax=Sphingomonas sp. TaxID=28214 RepID=UPI0025EFB224|nr:hypothetical protein [Sphingomonas sp.]